MALTVPYATRLARALEPYGLKWMEEFLPPDSYDGYKEVRENLRGCNVMLTTGEHEYTRYMSWIMTIFIKFLNNQYM